MVLGVFMSKKSGDIVFEWNGFKIKKILLKENKIIYRLIYLEVDKKGNSSTIIKDFSSLDEAKSEYKRISINGN